MNIIDHAASYSAISAKTHVQNVRAMRNNCDGKLNGLFARIDGSARLIRGAGEFLKRPGDVKIALFTSAGCQLADFPLIESAHMAAVLAAEMKSQAMEHEAALAKLNAIAKILGVETVMPSTEGKVPDGSEF